MGLCSEESHDWCRSCCQHLSWWCPQRCWGLYSHIDMSNQTNPSAECYTIGVVYRIKDQTADWGFLSTGSCTCKHSHTCTSMRASCCNVSFQCTRVWSTSIHIRPSSLKLTLPRGLWGVEMPFCCLTEPLYHQYLQDGYLRFQRQSLSSPVLLVHSWKTRGGGRPIRVRQRGNDSLPLTWNTQALNNINSQRSDHYTSCSQRLLK